MTRRPLVVLTRPQTVTEIRAETLANQAALGIPTERREGPRK